MKPVDVDDLLAVLDPTPLADPVVPVASRYPLDSTSIELLRLEGPATHAGHGARVADDVTRSRRVTWLPERDWTSTRG